MAWRSTSTSRSISVPESWGTFPCQRELLSLRRQGDDTIAPRHLMARDCCSLSGRVPVWLLSAAGKEKPPTTYVSLVSDGNSFPPPLPRLSHLRAARCMLPQDERERRRRRKRRRRRRQEEGRKRRNFFSLPSLSKVGTAAVTRLWQQPRTIFSSPASAARSRHLRNCQSRTWKIMPLLSPHPKKPPLFARGVTPPRPTRPGAGWLLPTRSGNLVAEYGSSIHPAKQGDFFPILTGE